MSAEKLNFPGKYSEEEKDMMDELAFNMLVERANSELLSRLTAVEAAELVYNEAEAMIIERRKRYSNA